MKYLIFFIFSILAIPLIHSQSLMVQDSINGEADEIQCDLFGNLYAIQNQYLIKYDTLGNRIAQYSNLRLGDISSANTSNFQKLFLFYNESGYVVLLNDRLSEISNPFNLNTHLSETFSLACPSYNQGFWCYNPLERKLIRTDRYFNKPNESPYLTDFDTDFSPVQLFEIDEKWVVLYDSIGTLCFLDKFGTFVKKMEIPSTAKIQMTGNLIFYIKDQLLHVYNYQTLTEKKYPIDIQNIKQVIFNQRDFYLLTQKGHIFRMSLKY